ncbi:ArsR/SmtB family transcription factor [Paenibacillus ehimensis]|uniref:Metalloregulator ArsR/SmtB family transcription factor n=1 Tax=Paenibacillus ehimensis TaxID=79264 RepID=A0ABT8VLN6_9BACL|nr:metalloregulator ArsR/SmtB family transcription factor [Paenibacillus ehimensis]MDO3681898.1 metalloregulator ArsR/SmtB family transcription factor [Paenibacillus ehimensis]
MDIIQATGRKRETYQVRLEYSLLWECAMGIAAVTNTPLLHTLEKPADEWKRLKASLSEDMLGHLAFVEKHNTWKALLQLLHQEAFASLSAFLAYIERLPPRELKSICLPYLGTEHQDSRQQAASGDRKAVQELQELTSGNPFFPAYIDFICKTDPAELKRHLAEVMSGWHEAVIEPEAERLLAVLTRDCEAKRSMRQRMAPEELVEWATGGVAYSPEPSVHRVLLIPQIVYRPWTIEADIEGTKVFHYPVASDSIHPADKYLPDASLVLRHKALGDEIRLRILKLLAEEDRSLQDLTDRLNMGKSTIHHHLKLLRAARLVDIRDAKYRVKTKAIDTLAQELADYLRQDE